jgi:hypothetical protein
MGLEDLSPDQLEKLGKIRERRRQITAEAVNESRELRRDVNAASTRRSERRHRFMLLAGGIVGVAGPILLQRTAASQADWICLGSGLLLFTVIVGAIFDAIDERRTTPVLVAASRANRQAAALALAEDAKLISALSGKPDPAADEMVRTAKADANAAQKPLREAAEWFANVSTLESVLFYGSFVLGVSLLILAVSRAG